MTTLTVPLSIRVVLLDIEGTTTPIDFVYNILFPYARDRTESFLLAHHADLSVRADISQLIEENLRDRELGLPPPGIRGAEDFAGLTAYVHWLMDQDRKSTPLKSLQGRIWESGYCLGELRSQVFPDVLVAFAGWRSAQVDICIYSSGSVLAQKLLFSHTESGDLSGFIRDYFDTNVGAKREAGSYQRIAGALGEAPAGILFISDVVAELDAAAQAGMQTRLCLRVGNPPQPPSSHAVIHSFDEQVT